MNLQLHDILIPTDCIEEDKLRRFAESMSKATGMSYAIATCYVVTTGDAEMAGALEIFRSAAMVAGPIVDKKAPSFAPPAKKVRRARRILKGAEKKAKAKAEPGSKSWRREDTNEVDSARAWKKAVAAGSVPVYTVFITANGTRLIVSHKPQLVKEPKP